VLFFNGGKSQYLCVRPTKLLMIPFSNNCIVLYNDTTNPLLIGKSNNSTTPFDGNLSDSRICSRTLTANEIAILARHPLAAYECRPLPRVFAFTGAAVKFAPWLRRQRMRMTGT
jgi:hypothetical protein